MGNRNVLLGGGAMIVPAMDQVGGEQPLDDPLFGHGLGKNVTNVDDSFYSVRELPFSKP